MGILNKMLIDMVCFFDRKYKHIRKNNLRNKIKQKRKQMNPDDCFNKSKHAQKLFLQSSIYKNAKTIMLYMPLGNETDTSEILKKSLDDEKNVVMPVTDDKTGIITPMLITKQTPFKKGAFSVKEPQCDTIADVSNIDVVLVPGIVFDKIGGRIGFGKGCYDMLLKNTNAVKVGYCYDFQLIKKIPSQIHDIKMDYINTENEITEYKKY